MKGGRVQKGGKNAGVAARASAVRSSEPDFRTTVWLNIRPYIQCVVEDFLISVMLWLGLRAFHLVTEFLRIDGLAAKVIVWLHGVGTVCAFALFIGLFIWDVIDIRLTKEKK